MKSSSTDRLLDQLIRQARGEEPFGASRDYGFETRVRESMRNSVPGAFDVFGTLCWRASLICLPVVIPALIVIATLNSLQIPEGMSSLVSIFRLDTLSIF